MRTGFAVALFSALISLTSAAAEDDPLAAYLWESRLVVVFADSARDPRFIEQMEELSARPDDLDERDVVVLSNTEPNEPSALRSRLRPRGFQVILIGKDGEIKLRRPHPMEAEALNRQIDRMPMRRREMQGGQG